MNNDSFPVFGDVTTIEQVDRVLNYVDNKILDFIDKFAGLTDQLQRKITERTGLILINVGKRIKKDQQAIGRRITKYQKVIDSAVVNSGKLDVSIASAIDDANLGNPLEISDIDSGQLPATGNSPSDDDGSTPVNPVNPVEPPCTPFTTRVNPDTCQIEICTASGWQLTGGYDQACLNSKNNVPPDDGDGDNGNLNDKCKSWTDSQGVIHQPAVMYICGGEISVSGHIDAGPATARHYEHMFGLCQNFDIDPRNQSYSQWSQQWNYSDNAFKQVPVIAVVTPSRSAPFNVSPNSEDGEYLIWNKYGNGISTNVLDQSTTYNDYVTRIMPSPDIDTIASEIGYLTVSESWKS